MRKLAAAAVAVCLASGIAAVAIADSGFVKDPSGDVQGAAPNGVKRADLDLVRATYGHHSPGRLVHRISVAGSVRNPNTSAAPHAGLRSNFPFMFISVPGGPGLPGSCDYSIVVNGDTGNGGFHQGAHLYTCNPNVHEVAPAKVTKVDSNTLRYAFGEARIRNPDSYGFSFSFEGTNNNSFDAVPDNGFKRHTLK